VNCPPFGVGVAPLLVPPPDDDELAPPPEELVIMLPIEGALPPGAHAAAEIPARIPKLRVRPIMTTLFCTRDAIGVGPRRATSSLAIAGARPWTSGR
jgi:hypothetical protein